MSNAKKYAMKTQKEIHSLFKRRINLDDRVDLLYHQMKKAINSQEPFNISIPPHVEITEALHRLVYSEGKPEQLKIRYNDRSVISNSELIEDLKKKNKLLEINNIELKWNLFPVQLLWKPKEFNWDPNQKTHLHIGTLSFRHVDYDKYVDTYLIRDKVTRQLNQKEIEGLAYTNMTKILDSKYVEDETYISIYQTGLEPLIVGVYRAITLHLVNRNKNGLPPMRIRPIYFINSEGVKSCGTIWGTGIIS
jgi:hypothetical protein